MQLPLAKGDAVFFNPALFHGAGTSRTADVRRMAHLLQVSSAFGRPLESVDRTRAIIALYPTLLARSESGAPTTEIANVIAASAEGYPFPPIGAVPGPGPADRQSEPGNAGGARPAGAGFPLGGSPLPEHRRSERC